MKTGYRFWRPASSRSRHACVYPQDRIRTLPNLADNPRLLQPTLNKNVHRRFEAAVHIFGLNMSLKTPCICKSFKPKKSVFCYISGIYQFYRFQHLQAPEDHLLQVNLVVGCAFCEIPHRTPSCGVPDAYLARTKNEKHILLKYIYSRCEVARESVAALETVRAVLEKRRKAY